MHYLFLMNLTPWSSVNTQRSESLSISGIEEVAGLLTSRWRKNKSINSFKHHGPPETRNLLSIYGRAWNAAAIYHRISHSSVTYSRGTQIICISRGGIRAERCVVVMVWLLTIFNNALPPPWTALYEINSNEVHNFFTTNKKLMRFSCIRPLEAGISDEKNYTLTVCYAFLSIYML